jgi:class 3 adenylate cyclase
MECPRCHAENPPEAMGCSQCGQRFAHRCAACGHDSHPGARFCAQCGARLGPIFSPKRKGPVDGATDKAERRQLTVMFCDLVGSTALSERLDPEDLLEIVRRYQSVAAEVVGRYEGTVAQHLGDGILAYFGYPEAHEDDPRRAVMSGLDIVKALGPLNEAMESERGTAIAVRIAVHTGEVVTAQIAAGEHLALGSTPNVAARVQAAANPGEVLITESTYARVRRSFEYSTIGQRTLPGLAKPVVLYRALEPVRAEASQPVASPGQTPFVGRDAALQRILQSAAAARERRGQVVLVKAEPGLGKSRLLQEVRERLAADNQRWVTCACSPYHQDTSFYAMAGFVEQLVEIQRGDEPAARLAKLESKLRQLNVERDEALPLLSIVLSIHSEASQRSQLTPDRQRQRTLDLLFELVRRAAPIVFAMEDLHWVDPSTLEFLIQLVDRIADEQVLALFTYRSLAEDVAQEDSVFKNPWKNRTNCLELELPLLTDRQAQQMVSEWDVARRLAPHVIRELVSRAGGVPLFLEELTKTVVEATQVAGTAIGSTVAATLPAVIPGALRDTLTARLDALGAAKEVAQLGAVIGREFRYDILREISSLDPDALDRQLARVVESGLVHRSGDIPDVLLSFKHALIQETAHESLLKTRRRALHHRVVDVLNDRFPAVAENEPETIARHCEEAGLFDQGSKAWQRVATRASEQWAYLEAIHGFSKALSMLEQLPGGRSRDERELALLKALQDPRYAISGYAADDQPELNSRIQELTRTLGPVDELSRAYPTWGFACIRNDRRKALGARREVEEIAAGTAQPAIRAVADWVSGATDFYDGQQSRALDSLNRVVDSFRKDRAHAESLQGVTANSHFLAWLVQGWALAISGYVAQALASLSEAVIYAEQHRGPFDVTQALSHQIAATWVVGPHLETIRELADKELALSQEHQLPQTLYLARHCLGWIAAATGDERGIDEMRAAIKGIEELGYLVIIANLQVFLADGLRCFGRDDEALTTADDALKLCADGLGRYYESAAHQIKGELLWKRGDWTAGEVSLRRASQVAESQGAKMFELRAATALARLLGDVEGASARRHRLAEVYRWFQGQPDGGYLGDARELLKTLAEE